MHCIEKQENKLENILDLELISKAEKAISDKEPVLIRGSIKNTDRTTGAMLSGRIASLYGSSGLPDGTIKCRFSGSAGQSFGAFLVSGVELFLEGDSNDYLGKGLIGRKNYCGSACRILI